MPAEQRAFIDSNIVLYALGTDLLKKQAAWRILFQFPLIPVQVLNECIVLFAVIPIFPAVPYLINL